MPLKKSKLFNFDKNLHIRPFDFELLQVGKFIYLKDRGLIYKNHEKRSNNYSAVFSLLGETDKMSRIECRLHDRLKSHALFWGNKVGGACDLYYTKNCLAVSLAFLEEFSIKAEILYPEEERFIYMMHLYDSNTKAKQKNVNEKRYLEGGCYFGVEGKALKYEQNKSSLERKKILKQEIALFEKFK
jgi:hypothetical protein